MSIVVSKKPSVFIPNRELVITYPKFSKTTLADLVSGANGFEGITKNILSRLLEKLTELSIPFKFVDLKIEHDAEIESWKYVVVKIKLGVRAEIFSEVCDLLITDAYSKVNPKDAVKVLLEFEHV